MTTSPSPWKFKPSNDPAVPSEIVDAKGMLVAHVYGSGAEIHGPLLAAVCELFDALVDVCDNAQSDSPDMWQRACDAIAKAKGKEPCKPLTTF